jgi:hypothetical protein
MLNWIVSVKLAPRRIEQGKWSAWQRSPYHFWGNLLGCKKLFWASTNYATSHANVNQRQIGCPKQVLPGSLM